MGRRGGSRSRPLICCAVLLLLAAAASALLLVPARPAAPEDAVQPAPEEPAQPPVRSLRGTVQDALMHTLVVTAEDGTAYEFDKGDAEISAGATGILVGNPVTVTFRGQLDPGTTAQQVQVLSIAVEDPPAPAVPPASEPSPEERAQAILSEMTLEERVGQMFLARFPKEDAAALAADFHLGGYILFSRDFRDRTPEQVRQTIADCQQGASLPMFMAVDEEGGTVTRVSRFPQFRDTPFLSPQQLYAAGGLEAVQADAAEKCRLLLGLGLNMNFAPVCDISRNPEDFMYARSFGQDAAQTARYVQTVVSEMKAQGMGSVLKHFPGYGSSADTHTGIAWDDRPYETFVASDFLPFQAGIDAGADLVLVSHNIVRSMDDQRPASLSPKVHQILREELGFEGVIVTDDLQMDGVRDFAGDEQAAVLAVQAGNDLLCCTDFQTQLPAVVRAVEAGEIAQAQIDQSVLRILKLKLALGLLD